MKYRWGCPNKWALNILLFLDEGKNEGELCQKGLAQIFSGDCSCCYSILFRTFKSCALHIVTYIFFISANAQPVQVIFTYLGLDVWQSDSSLFKYSSKLVPCSCR